MHKSDYAVIARTINNRRIRSINDVERLGIEILAIELAAQFLLDNSRFDSDKFLQACGVTNIPNTTPEVTQ